MKKRVFYLTIIAVVFLLFFSSFVKADGTWEQFQRDANMSAYQEVAGTYVTPNSTAGEGLAFQPLVNDFDGERKIISFEITDTIKIYNSTFELEKETNISSGVYSFTTFDFDGDGHTEIILLQKNNATTDNFTVYQYLPSTLTLTKEKEIPFTISNAKYGNIVCGKFIGDRDCIFANGGDLSRTFLFSFNSTSNNQDSNPLKQIYSTTLGWDTNQLYNNITGRLFISLTDQDADGDNEINFALHQIFLSIPERAKFYSINKTAGVQRSFWVYTCTVSLTIGEETRIDNIVTKVQDLGDGGTPEVIVGINAKLVYEPNYEGSSISISNSSGTQKQSKCYRNYMHIIAMPYLPDYDAYCPIQLDFAVKNDAVYVFSNYRDQLIGTHTYPSTANCFPDTHANGWLELDLFNYSGATVDAYFNKTYKGVMFGNLQIGDFDSNGKLDFMTIFGVSTIEDYATSDMPFLPFSRSIVTRGGEGIDQMGIKDATTPADINNDGITEIIAGNGTDSNLYYFNISAGNSLPSINSIIYSPSLCIDPNSTLTITILATDPENDTIGYAHKCSDVENMTAFNSSDTRNCFYTNEGSYSNTIFVNDTVHTTWNSYSRGITVKMNCTQGEADWSIPLPTEIIERSTEAGRETRGLLPEIYFGIVAFFKFLPPLAILGFVFLSVMVIVAVGFIIQGIVRLIVKLGN